MLGALIAQDLATRWSGGILTWAWALIQPLVQIALYAVVFGALMAPRGGVFASHGTYVIFLCSGVFLWVGFSEAVSRGANALREGASQLRGRPLPLALFPLKVTGTAWILALVGFIGTLAVAPLVGVSPSWTWLLLPVPYLALVLLAGGLGLLLAPLTVLARDTLQLVQLVLPLVFWATPIVYAPSILPDWAQAAQQLNPLALAVGAVHDLLLTHQVPDLAAWGRMLLAPVLVLALGAYALRRLDLEVRDAL